MSARPLGVLLLAGLLAAAGPPAGRAAPPAPGPAPPDSALGRFLGQFSDSTDRYFGAAAAPLDTAGLDTVLEDSAHLSRRLDRNVVPGFTFNRVDGSTFGLTLGLEGPFTSAGRARWGRLEGSIARAAGSGTVLGGARYRHRLRVARQPFDLRLAVGRSTDAMNRDDSEAALNTVRALLFGADWMHYLRRDGFEGSIAHDHGAWRALAAWRDQLESPLAPTATWNLAGRRPDLASNLPAALGRVREARYGLGIRWPLVPLATEAELATSSRRLGSDFEYRRARAAAGMDLTLGRALSLLPQAAWGHLSGEALPQDAFYLGEGTTLRSLHRDDLGGSTFAAARLDLIEAPDLLELLRLPHPAALPLQAGVFAGSAAVSGRDPYTGAVTPGDGWPEPSAWRSEAGVSLLYSSALFESASFLRLSCAWPLGPERGPARWSLTFSRALDLLLLQPSE